MLQCSHDAAYYLLLNKPGAEPLLTRFINLCQTHFRCRVSVAGGSMDRWARETQVNTVRREDQVISYSDIGTTTCSVCHVQVSQFLQQHDKGHRPPAEG